MSTRVLADWECRAIHRHRRAGETVPNIAAAYGVSVRTVQRVLAPSRPHYCEWDEPSCPVMTVRRLCYFHARAA